MPNPIPPVPSLAPAARASALPQSGNVTLPKDVVSYPLTDAASGLTCPQTQTGYSCELRFAMSPSPSPNASGTPSATPSASPTPSPSPIPSSPPSASPSPQLGATIELRAAAMPKDAPKMVQVPKNVLNAIPLMMVTMTTSADFPIQGPCTATFTLPQEQIGGRGFALQLFSVKGKRTKSYTPIWNFNKASLSGMTLTFAFNASNITVGKGATYVLVLYGDELSTAGKVTPLPSLTPLPSPTPSPVPSPSPTALSS